MLRLDSPVPSRSAAVRSCGLLMVMVAGGAAADCDAQEERCQRQRCALPSSGKIELCKNLSSVKLNTFQVVYWHSKLSSKRYLFYHTPKMGFAQVPSLFHSRRDAVSQSLEASRRFVFTPRNIKLKERAISFCRL